LIFKHQGRCAVCSSEAEDHHGLVIDHCHDRGVIRGLLCQGCNLALGAVKDAPDTLRKLADYLEKSVVEPGGVTIPMKKGKLFREPVPDVRSP
jgi:hypothetical protein